MSDKPQRWPLLAAAARNQAAELAVEGMRLIAPLMDAERAISEAERVRRLGRAHQNFTRIAWLMAHQGAPVRPEDI